MQVRARGWIGRIACIGLALAPSIGWPDVYLWTDEVGRVHMTDDLAQVPVAQRSRAAKAGKQASATALAVPEGSLDPLAPRPAVPAAPARSQEPKRSVAGRRHVLNVERVGSSMRVLAIVDGVQIPFILDTGATTCTVPRWALEELGVVLDEDTPLVPISGISGEVMLVPEIRVKSVQVGGATVSDLHMTVLDTMDEGLLGMPFFNHFKVSTDPIAGMLMLEEIDLSQLGDVAGGLNERAWRQKFNQRRYALAMVQAQLEDLPYEYVTIRERLEEKARYWERQLELLDLEATRAGVPYDWRE